MDFVGLKFDTNPLAAIRFKEFKQEELVLTYKQKKGTES